MFFNRLEKLFSSPLLFIIISTFLFANLKIAKAANNEIAIFPEATGFGTTTVAGSGRHLSPAATQIYRVTNLADAGEGSLRNCIEATVPRTCIFETSGRIDLTKKLVISHPYITIAGQTAPAPGILISGAGIQVSSHDVLIQHLQVRVGDNLSGPDPETRDALTIAATNDTVYNVVIDRVSISWAIDENLSTWYPNINDLTISNSIISEALYNSIHPKGPHGMGFLIGENTKRISVHSNLFAHNNDRNPRMSPGVDLEFASNIVYNWGGTSGWNTANLYDSNKTENPVNLNFIGNYFIPGINSPNNKSIYGSGAAQLSRVYVKDNLDYFRKSFTEDEWKVSGLDEKFRSRVPTFSLSNFPATDALKTYSDVLNNSGARVAEANSVDERIKSEVLTRTGSIKDCVQGCANSANGYPAMAVVLRELIIPENPNDDYDGNGYTNLEDWLHSFSKEVQDLSGKTKVPDLAKESKQKKSKEIKKSTKVKKVNRVKKNKKAKKSKKNSKSKKKNKSK